MRVRVDDRERGIFDGRIARVHLSSIVVVPDGGIRSVRVRSSLVSALTESVV
jgi:hypothetical protein